MRIAGRLGPQTGQVRNPARPEGNTTRFACAKSARIGIADRLSILDDVGEHQDFWVSGKCELGPRTDLELSKSARKRDLLRRAQLLITKD